MHIHVSERADDDDDSIDHNNDCDVDEDDYDYADDRHGICQKFYTIGFSGKNFTPSISPNFNSFSKKKHKK